MVHPGHLEAARHLDWRFLLPTPALRRVALAGAAGADLAAALATAADEVGRGTDEDLARHGPWDVVLVGGPEGMDPAKLERALALLRPGGWLIVNGSGRASRLRASTSRLSALGCERVHRAWYLPNRAKALRIVPLDDQDALRLVLTRHSGRASRRLMAAAARGLVGAGLPAELLGGEVSILARRAGGEALAAWPSLEPLTATLRAHGLDNPSWILLTPRFPASAHVVMLLLAEGHVRLVAKIARLAGDDSPRHEAQILDTLHAGDMVAGSAPRSVATADVAGHTVLLEEALEGRALDRRLVRQDPTRWIRETATWLATLPAAHDGQTGRIEALVGEPLRRLRDALPQDRPLADLVERTLGVLADLNLTELPSVFEHGDLSHPNLLVRPDGGLAVLDWELARRDGLPLHDLAFFLGYVALATGGADEDPADGFVRVLAHPTWGAATALQAEAARLRIGAKSVPGLIVACWARVFTSLVERASITEPEGRHGQDSSSRYHRLWEGAVDRRAQLEALLA